MLRCKVGSFAVSTGGAGTTQAITGVGFQPKAIIFFWCGRVTNNSEAANDHQRGFGVAVSPTSRHAVTTVSQNAVADAQSQTDDSDAACIRFLNASGTLDGYLDHQSMDTDGFTLIVDDQISSAHRVGYMALGGDEKSGHPL